MTKIGYTILVCQIERERIWKCIYMISYIKGSLEHKGDNNIIIECGGIGYGMTVSGQFMDKLPPVHSEMKAYTYLNVREDGISLFGFYSQEELDIFRILTGVSGVGPKVAMSILSSLTVNELKLAVISEDVKSISRANGVGAKGASRIILELKDKLSIEDMLDAAYDSSVDYSEVPSGHDVRADVITALTSLGYTGVEAGRAVSSVEGALDMDEEKLLKEALKRLI